MTSKEAKEFLIHISYQLGNMGVEYLTEKDGEKMREAVDALETPNTYKFDVAISKMNDAIKRLREVKECSILGAVVLVDTKIQTYNHCIDILKELKGVENEETNS